MLADDDKEEEGEEEEEEEEEGEKKVEMFFDFLAARVRRDIFAVLGFFGTMVTLPTSTSADIDSHTIGAALVPLLEGGRGTAGLYAGE
jgi:hypothetical protein